MWGRGFQQRTIEELVKSETGADPASGGPRRPRTWLRAGTVFGLLELVGAFVVASDFALDAGPGTEPATDPPATTAPPAT